MNVPSLTVSYQHTTYGLKTAFAAIVLLFTTAALGHCNSGCALFNGPETTGLNGALEHSYTTEIVACAATAGYPGAYDRDTDLRCRAGVDCRYGLGPCPDGGK